VVSAQGAFGEPGVSGAALASGGAGARHGTLHPCSPEPAALLCAAAKALGSCLTLAEIVVEFADSARRELNTCSQTVCPSVQLLAMKNMQGLSAVITELC